MIVYFADRRLEILGLASTELDNGTHIIADNKITDVESGTTTFQFTISYDKSAKDLAERMTEAGNYILRVDPDEDRKEFYTIIDEDIDKDANEIEIYAEDGGLDFLNDIALPFYAAEEHPIEWYINRYIEGSGFEIKQNELNDANPPRYVLGWDSESTVTSRLDSIAYSFDAEIDFTFDIEGLRLTGKYINIYKKRGKSIAAKLRVGYELSNIRIKKSVANLATALYATGAYEETAIDFENSNVIIVGDGLANGDNGWAARFVSRTNCFGVGIFQISGGFAAKGVSGSTYQNKNFAEALKALGDQYDEETRLAIDYIVVGGGYRDTTSANSGGTSKVANCNAGIDLFAQYAKTYFPYAKIFVLPIHGTKTADQISNYNVLEESWVQHAQTKGMITCQYSAKWFEGKIDYDAGDGIGLTDDGLDIVAQLVASFMQGWSGDLDDERDTTTMKPITLQGYEYDDGDCYVDGMLLKSRTAMTKWGRISNANYNVVRSFSYDTDNQIDLCARAVDELKKISQTEVNYEVEIVYLPKNVTVGDTVYLVDEADRFYLQTRLLRLEKSITDDTYRATFGEFIIADGGISDYVKNLATDFQQASAATMALAAAANNTANALKNVAITQSYNQYAQNASPTTPPQAESMWSTTVPTWEDGKFIWMRTVTTVADITEISDPVCITGAKGQSGASGKGIAARAVYYALSQNTTAPAYSSFTTAVQTPTSTNKYLWSYEIITYTDTTTDQTDRHIIGVYGDTGQDGQNGQDGQDGQDGAPGADGKGIVSITVYYAVNNSNTSAPTTGWSTTPMAPTADNKYLWSYETTAYTTGSPTSTEKHIIGTYGRDGTDGTDGEDGEDGRGVVSQTTYYLLTNTTTVPDWSAGWSTTASVPTSSNKYLWSYEYILYTDTTDTTTARHIVGMYGEKGQDGTNGTDGTDGTGISSITTYFALSTTTTPPSAASYTTTAQFVTPTDKYLWSYQTTTFTDATTSSTTPTIIGVYGDTGNGVSAVSIRYRLSTSIDEIAGSYSWADEAPEVVDGTFLWSRYKVTYTNGTIGYTDPMCESRVTEEVIRPILNQTESSLQTYAANLVNNEREMRLQAQSQYVENSTYQNYQQNLETRLSVMDDGLSVAATKSELKEYVDDLGRIQEFSETVEKYLTFDAIRGLVLSALGSNIESVISNTAWQLVASGKVVQQIDANEGAQFSSIVLKSLTTGDIPHFQLGHLVIVANADGTLTGRKA